MGLLDFNFSGAAPGYDSFLTPEQKKELQRQANLAMGIQMMMSGSSGLGGIGQGFAAGQDTYFSNAKSIYDSQVEAQKLEMERKLQQLKLDDYQRKVNLQDRISAILNGEAPAQGSPAPSMGGQAEAAPGPAMSAGIPMPTVGADGSISDASVPTASPAPAMAAAPQMTDKQKKAALYRKVADAIAAADPEKADKYYAMADKIDPLPDYGTPQEAMVAGKRRLVQYDKRGGYRIVDGIDPAISLPSEVGAVEYITGTPLAGTGQAGMDQVGNYNKSKAVNVNIGQDKSFQNEMDLRKEFSALPIAKAFTEVQTAYDQIRTALKNPSPANDMAAATKFMKLLDPGSVVRESELNMAMNATGLWDRMQNYYKLMLSGEKLTTKQRKDFYAAADGLYRAAQGRYLPEVQRYRGMASGYNLNPENVAAPPAAAPAVEAAPAAVQPAKTYNPKTGNWE